MNATHYFLLLITLSACAQKEQAQITEADLNNLNINKEIVQDISNVTRKHVEKNVFTRYTFTNREGEFEETVDTVSNSIIFRFVSDKEAYKIIDKHFHAVRESGNYLFLTNLDFDDAYNSYYDIVIAPVKDQLALIRYVGTEPVNYALSNEDVVNWFSKNQEAFNFYIYVADISRIEARIVTAPPSYKALAEEMYEFCPDVIDQGHEDMDELISYIKSEKHMWFWWD